MARPREELTNPVTGQTIRFVRTAAETDGEVLEVESRWRGGGRRAPAHYHPHQDEQFEVLEGELEVVLDGERRTLRPGDTLTVPRGAVHEMWAEDPEGARARWETRPAMSTERMFESIWGLAEDGRVHPRSGAPMPLDFGPIAHRHRHEFRLAKPPWPLQRAALAALAVTGRLAGRPSAYDSKGAGERSGDGG